MGTTVEFNIAAAEMDISVVSGACEIAESRIAELDSLLSAFNRSSALSKINDDREKKTVLAAPDLFRVMERAKEYYMLSGGAYDVTAAPLIELWGFGPDKGKAPDPESISKALNLVGFDKIGLNPADGTLTFNDPGIRIDLGGIAKGYAVDQAVKILRAEKIDKGIINLGGDLYCLGSNEKNEDWVIGIRDPDDKKSVLARLSVRDKAIATSGDYENFHIYNDKKYCHIIDPRSGLPIENKLSSVTVIANDCTAADALATAIFVLGEHEGLKLVEKIDEVECLLVLKKNGRGGLLTSSGMGIYLR